jgi:hypothetical protein
MNHRRSTFIGIFALTNIPQSYFLYRCVSPRPSAHNRGRYE